MLEAPGHRVEQPSRHHQHMTSADSPRAGREDRPVAVITRRTCLTVPGSSERFLAKSASLAADELIFDLEDAVAPAAKRHARSLVTNAVSAFQQRDEVVALPVGPPTALLTTGPVLAVRINGALTEWAFRDVIDVVAGAGARLDAIVLPKVSDPAHVAWLDLLLGQLERAQGLPAGGIAIEAQIEDAAGLAAVREIALASSRLAALIFGPADFMASVGMRSLRIGAQPDGYTGGDAFHYPLMQILVAARAAGLQAIDGPYAAIGDSEGLKSVAASAAALGYDGKWVVHPDQIEPVNAAFSPSQQEYDRALGILDAYEHATSEGPPGASDAGRSPRTPRGAVMYGGEMIDAASRKLALAVVARGRAAGLTAKSP
jgi:citrate lyase subunit beta / citryl-CoA lyase